MGKKDAKFLTVGGATVRYTDASKEMVCEGCGHSPWLASAAESNAHATSCRAMPPES